MSHFEGLAGLDSHFILMNAVMVCDKGQALGSKGVLAAETERAVGLGGEGGLGEGAVRP